MKNGHVKLLLGLSAIFGLVFGIPVSADKSDSVDVDVEFTFEPYLDVSLSSELLSIEGLTPGTFGESDPTNITIKTNNLTGYSMTATVGNATHASRQLENTAGATGYNFDMVTTDTEDDDLTGPKWGYRKVAGPTDTDGTWSSIKTALSGLPLYSDTGAEIAEISHSTVGPINHVVQFRIGAKAADDHLSGTYENVINFTVVANIIDEVLKSAPAPTPEPEPESV